LIPERIFEKRYQHSINNLWIEIGEATNDWRVYYSWLKISSEIGLEPSVTEELCLINL